VKNGVHRQQFDFAGAVASHGNTAVVLIDGSHLCEWQAYQLRKKCSVNQVVPNNHDLLAKI
jgi:hypothetical protein